jgi:NAD(P)-dependent dehydrogenase (short-subunit alcohol dehydrogenase family)
LKAARASTIVPAMPQRRAVLLCGQARTTLAAIAHELGRAGIPLVIQAAPAEMAAGRKLAAGANAIGGATIVRGELGSEAASRRLVTAAWKAVRAIDTVVICPTVASGGASSTLSLDEWRNGLDAGLRAPFFLAKHAGLRLHRGGRLIVAIGAPPRMGQVAEVVRAGLLCMVDALARALPHAVEVRAVVDGGRTGATSAAAIARGVRLLLDDELQAGGAILELGPRARRG